MLGKTIKTLNQNSQSLILEKQKLILELEKLERKLRNQSLNPTTSGVKEVASPVQTVTGKDLSNPLRGVVFPKNQENPPVKGNMTASPSSQADGKGLSGPVMAAALPKSRQEGHIITLPDTMTLLRELGLVKEPKTVEPEATKEEDPKGKRKEEEEEEENPEEKEEESSDVSPMSFDSIAERNIQNMMKT